MQRVIYQTLTPDPGVGQFQPAESAEVVARCDRVGVENGRNWTYLPQMWLYCHMFHLLGGEAMKSYIHTSPCIYLDVSSFIFTYLHLSSPIFICVHLSLFILFAFIHLSSLFFQLLNNYKTSVSHFPQTGSYSLLVVSSTRGPMIMSYIYPYYRPTVLPDSDKSSNPSLTFICGIHQLPNGNLMRKFPLFQVGQIL